MNCPVPCRTCRWSLWCVSKVPLPPSDLMSSLKGIGKVLKEHMTLHDTGNVYSGVSCSLAMSCIKCIMFMFMFMYHVHVHVPGSAPACDHANTLSDECTKYERKTFRSAHFSTTSPASIVARSASQVAPTTRPGTGRAIPLPHAKADDSLECVLTSVAGMSTNRPHSRSFSSASRRRLKSLSRASPARD